MSYLDWPRLHFRGRFQADTSTVNNDVRHYKSDAFEPQFQEIMVGQGAGNAQRTNGYWNPEGTGAWRMLGCRFTGASLPGRSITDGRQDPIVGMRLAGSDARVAGKLVDLDPQQQMVSQIWGLRIAIDDLNGNRLLDSEYAVGTFTDLWKRQQIMQDFDQTLAAAFQSQLHDPTWGDLTASPVLRALEGAAADRLLSIRFNVFGFDRSPQADDYTTGVVVGTIGPASVREPRHFVVGRQLVPSLANPVTPGEGVYGCQALQHTDEQVLTIDLGNSLPIQTADGGFPDLGSLYLSVCRSGDVAQGSRLSEKEVAILGEVPYRDEGWYDKTAGIVDFDYSNPPDVVSLIGCAPLALLRKNTDSSYTVLVRESAEGLYVRADQHVFRLNPGQTAEVAFYATRYGVLTDAALILSVNNGLMGGAGTGATLTGTTWPIPEIGEPRAALHHPQTLGISADAPSMLTIKADDTGPGNPRGYIDGQVYGIGYQFTPSPAGFVDPFWNFISVLLWDRWDVPHKPTWYRDIQPILAQYGNLYPIMSRHLVDLGDYDSVVAHLPSLRFSFSLPASDPNSMPVSRDLSANKLAGILKWLDDVGADGLPLKGEPSEAPATKSPRHVLDPSVAVSVPAPDPGGKFDVVLQAATRAAAHGADRRGDGE